MIKHPDFISALRVSYKDPFDRILVAQAECEGFMLLTSDSLVAQYPGPIQLV